MDFLSIATQLLNANEYTKAIEAARKANKENDNWQAFDIIGTAFFNMQEFDAAIKNFNLALNLNPGEPNVRKKYAWSLYSAGKYKLAIEQWEDIGVCEEDLDLQTFKMLGHCYLQDSNYQYAINAFQRSLLISKDWLTYYRMGLAQYNLCLDNEAIDAFNNSLKERENWESYRYMAESLARVNQIEKSKLMTYKSIKVLQKITLTENQRVGENLYPIMALQYRKLNCIDKASRAFQVHYRCATSDIIQEVDPYLGISPRNIKASREEIVQLKLSLKSQGYTFIPSCISTDSEDSIQELWKNILHIHIPKCAGTNFERPLIRLMTALHEECLKCSDKKLKLKNYFWHGNMLHQHQVNGYVAELSQYDEIDNLFLVAHGANYSQYQAKLESLSKNIQKICLVRNPSERLYSCLRMESLKTKDIKVLRHELQKIPYNIYNSMDKHIYNYGLEGSDDETPYCNPTDYEKINDIEFINIDDEELIENIKSAFLCANNMPNIIQYNRINEHSSKAHKQYGPSDEELRDLHQELIESGSISRDMQIDFKYLTLKTRERIKIPCPIDEDNTLHPLTFILKSNGEYTFKLTKDILNNQELIFD